MPWLRPILAAVVACASGAAAPALGQIETPGAGKLQAPPGDGQPARPDAAKRIVKVFDFEEKRTNPTPVPEHFFRAQDDTSVPRERPGFPSWNAAELDYTVSHSGEGSVKLPIKGGSASLLLEPGVLPIFESADYLITAWIRTDKLTNAGASVAARFAGPSGKPLFATTVRSRPIRTEGQWMQVELELPGDTAGASFIQLELLTLQPEQAADPMDPTKPVDDKVVQRRKRMVWKQDFDGVAWFDDIAIVQLPRVELTLNSPSGLVASEQKPKFSLSVRDMTGETLRALVSVRDVEGNTVDIFDRTMGGGRLSASWEPKLTRYGWYRATLEVLNQSVRVGVSYVDFIWLPPAVGEENPVPTGKLIRGERDGFGLVINSIEPALAGVVPDIIKRSGVGAVTVPLWTRDLTQKDLDEALTVAGPSIDATIAGWGELTLSLSRVPDEVAVPLRIDADDPWTLFGTDPTKWNVVLDPFLDRYGQIVRRWQLGEVGDDRLFWRPDAAQGIDDVQRVLGKLVSGPIVTAPWRIDRGVPAALTKATSSKIKGPGARLSAFVPAECGPDDVRDFAAHWTKDVLKAANPPELALVFAPDRSDQTGYAEQTAALARKVISAWAAFSPGPGSSAGSSAAGQTPGFQGCILQPWTVVGERRPRLMPRPELAAWRTLHDMLSGRSVVATFPSPPGTVCYVLSPRPGEGNRGVLVGWNLSCEPDKAVIRNQLGAVDVRIVDLYGNRVKVAEEKLPDPGGRGKPSMIQIIPLGSTPTFVENVDINLVKFISSFCLKPAFIKSSSEEQENALVLTNPWPVMLEGRATIVQPGGFDPSQGVRDRRWTLQPRSFQFAIAPGQSQALPFNVSFTPAEEAGERDFVVQMDISADKTYSGLQLVAPAELGLEHVKLEVSAVPGGRGAGGSNDDVVIEARIVNTGKDPLSAELAVFAPGMPRMKASVAELAPGNETTRRFPFAKSLSKLRGQRVVVSLSESETPNRLNRAVTVE